MWGNLNKTSVFVTDTKYSLLLWYPHPYPISIFLKNMISLDVIFVVNSKVVFYVSSWKVEMKRVERKIWWRWWIWKKKRRVIQWWKCLFYLVLSAWVILVYQSPVLPALLKYAYSFQGSEETLNLFVILYLKKDLRAQSTSIFQYDQVFQKISELFIDVHMKWWFQNILSLWCDHLGRLYRLLTFATCSRSLMLRGACAWLEVIVYALMKFD